MVMHDVAAGATAQGTAAHFGRRMRPLQSTLDRKASLAPARVRVRVMIRGMTMSRVRVRFMVRVTTCQG